MAPRTSGLCKGGTLAPVFADGIDAMLREAPGLDGAERTINRCDPPTLKMTKRGRTT
jgi:hypothetical protein